MQWPPVQSHIVSCVVCRRKYAPLPASQTPLHPACGSDFSFDTAITTSAGATMEDYCFYTFGQKVNEGSLKVRKQWKNQWTMKCLFFASVQAESVKTYFIVEFMCRLFVILVSLGFCLPRCLLSSLFQVTDHTPFFGYPGKMSCFYLFALRRSTMWSCCRQWSEWWCVHWHRRSFYNCRAEVFLSLWTFNHCLVNAAVFCKVAVWCQLSGCGIVEQTLI